MDKYIKYIVFICIVVFCLISTFLATNSNIEEDIYVVSESESEEINKTIPKNIEDKETEVENSGTRKSELIEKDKEITIFISGEVKNPGVVTLESDKRLAEAVDKLGGFTENADLNRINLAIKIEDEQHYIIPKVGEEIENYEQQNKTIEELSNNNSENKININTAQAIELDTLPGIGEVTANKIISYREEKGKFNTIEEIKNVNGIGDKKYEEIMDMISVD